MFNFFNKKINKKIELGKVAIDFADHMQSLKRSMDELTKITGISSKNNYRHEVAAFTYFIGWLAISYSNLSVEKKNSFMGPWGLEEFKRMNNGVLNKEIAKFVLSRKSLYNDAMINGDGKDEFARVIIRFLEQFDAALPQNGAVIIALHAAIIKYLEVLTALLNQLNVSGVIDWTSESR